MKNLATLEEYGVGHKNRDGPDPLFVGRRERVRKLIPA
jgi:hypothetical protein